MRNQRFEQVVGELNEYIEMEVIGKYMVLKLEGFGTEERENELWEEFGSYENLEWRKLDEEDNLVLIELLIG